MELVALAAQATTQLELNLRVNGIVALIAGILILIFPRILNYVVAAYLIIIGLIQVLNIQV